MEVRDATAKDAAQIAEIYNYYILNTPQTFETEALTSDDMQKRIETIQMEYPYLVAVEDSEILGYAYADNFKLRKAYNYACEVSIYVKNDAKKRGVGSRIYEVLFERLEQTNAHALLASIALPNDGSVSFHEKLGFRKVGHFEEIGYKLGRWVDVGFWEKLNY
ncbi:MAG: GNAT family N-acetyltransferase [Pyrinomonadaceae bacterium]